jgi:hypothetical protein
MNDGFVNFAGPPGTLPLAPRPPEPPQVLPPNPPFPVYHEASIPGRNLPARAISTSQFPPIFPFPPSPHTFGLPPHLQTSGPGDRRPVSISDTGSGTTSRQEVSGGALASGTGIAGAPSSPAGCVPEFSPGVPLPEARGTLAHASDEERIQYVGRCLQDAGFTSFLHLYMTLLTTDFQTKSCAHWQKEEFGSGPKELLAVFKDKAKVQRDAGHPMVAYEDAVIDCAADVVGSEFRRFCNPRDKRRRVPGTAKRQRLSREAPYLYLRTKKVDAASLANDVVGKAQQQFDLEVRST